MIIRFIVLLFSFVLPAALSAQSTWTGVSSGTRNNLWGVCYGGGQFVAVGENGTILTSPDGLAWTTRASGTNRWLTSVAYGVGQYVAVGDQGTVLHSFDGIAWENASLTSLERLNVVFFNGERFLMYGEKGRALTVGLPFRIDGQDRPRKPELSWFRAVATGHDRQVLGGELGLVVVGGLGNYFLVSLLAIDDHTGIRNVSGLVFDGDSFIAVGAGGKISTSIDGKTWDAVLSPTTANLQAIATFNHSLVAVGEQGTLLTKDLGSKWQRRSVPTDELLLGIAASEGAAIVVGGSGTILRATPTDTAPTIISGPLSTTESLGGVVSFSVRAAGSLPLAYQWFHDGAALAGETRAELIRASLSASDGGSYTAEVRNAAGTATSNPGMLGLSSSVAPVVDETFHADAALNGSVGQLVSLADGSILVAAYISTGASPAVSRLYKLRSDGSLAPDWTESRFTVEDSTLNVPSIRAVLPQPDGRFVVGGLFTHCNGQPRTNVIRLNRDGSLDPTFMAASEAVRQSVSSAALQSDGKILLANGGPTPLRLTPGGSLDPSFHFQPLPGATVPGFAILRDWTINGIAVTKNEKILVGAQVNLAPTLIAPNADTVMLQLLPDGSLDPSFTSRRYGGNYFSSLWPTDDGAVLVTLEFDFNSHFERHGRIRRFRTDGSEYPSYANPSAPFVTAAYAYPDGRVLYGALTTNSVGRFTSLGAPDTTFTGGVGAAFCISATASDKVLVGGDFTLYNGKPVNRVARLNAVPNETRNAPQIVHLVSDKTTVQVGEPITVRAIISGSPDMTYDWEGLSPATPLRTNSPVLPFSFASPGLQFIRLTAKNPRGEAKSESLYFTVLPAAPVITGDALKISAQQGRELTLSIGINSTTAGSCTFAWFHNGQPVANRIGNESPGINLELGPTRPADAGSYTVVVSNAMGVATTSVPIVVTIDDTSRFANLSTRGTVSEPQGMIAGFVIAGNRARTILVRGVGPSLARLGVTSALPDPAIALFDRTGRPVAAYTSDDWSTTSTATFTKVGAFPFEPGSKDASFTATLSPGNYTVQLTGKPGMSGEALIEIYEADNVAERMLNLSTRATMGGGTPVFTGFSISGPVSKRVLIRAAGPSLAGFGVANAHPDPRVTVRNALGAALASNDQWENYPERTELVNTFKATGAFPFPAGSKDAALIVTLPPGNYTAVLDSAENSTGVVLAEMYEVP